MQKRSFLLAQNLMPPYINLGKELRRPPGRRFVISGSCGMVRGSLLGTVARQPGCNLLIYANYEAPFVAVTRPFGHT